MSLGAPSGPGQHWLQVRLQAAVWAWLGLAGPGWAWQAPSIEKGKCGPEWEVSLSVHGSPCKGGECERKGTRRAQTRGQGKQAPASSKTTFQLPRAWATGKRRGSSISGLCRGLSSPGCNIPSVLSGTGTIWGSLPVSSGISNKGQPEVIPHTLTQSYSQEWVGQEPQIQPSSSTSIFSLCLPQHQLLLGTEAGPWSPCVTWVKS